MFGSGRSVMANDYRDCPTATLLARWERLRDKLGLIPPSEWDDVEADCLWEMRRELDRRKDIPKPTVDINFASDYLTD